MYRLDPKDGSDFLVLTHLSTCIYRHVLHTHLKDLHHHVLAIYLSAVAVAAAHAEEGRAVAGAAGRDGWRTQQDHGVDCSTALYHHIQSTCLFGAVWLFSVIPATTVCMPTHVMCTFIH